eukprot:1681793-Karenia_brevis.AAC.1
MPMMISPIWNFGPRISTGTWEDVIIKVTNTNYPTGPGNSCNTLTQTLVHTLLNFTVGHMHQTNVSSALILTL